MTLIGDKIKAAGLLLAAAVMLIADVAELISIDRVVAVPHSFVGSITIISTLLCLAALLAIVLVSVRPVAKDRQRTMLLALAIITVGFGAMLAYTPLHAHRLIEGTDCAPGTYFFADPPLSRSVTDKLDQVRRDNAGFASMSQRALLAELLCAPEWSRPLLPQLADGHAGVRIQMIMLIALAKTAIFSGLFLLLWSVTALDLRRGGPAPASPKAARDDRAGRGRRRGAARHGGQAKPVDDGASDAADDAADNAADDAPSASPARLIRP